MSECKSRVWLTSLFAGCLLSTIVTAAGLKAGAGYWFPPLWPGTFIWFAWTVLGHREAWNNNVAPAVIGTGNAVFYTWICLQILRAEILARGRLSRHFLR